jgi:arabinan endo-1,5-alpha-L-arabinosidase
MGGASRAVSLGGGSQISTSGGASATVGAATLGGTDSGGASAAGGTDTGGSSAAGGTTADGGSAGTGPVIVGDDRCDDAVYDPENPPSVLNMSGSLNTHDPTVIEQDGTFYLHNTGNGLPGKTSTDLASWSNAGAALSGKSPWAPDLSFFNDQYHLYYAVSSFGSNNSCIGHATRDSMTSGSWTDHGDVHCTTSSDDYNAIDPNIIVDIDDSVWMFFGSHWDGIKAIQLDPTGMETTGELYDIASRADHPRAIEAPVVVRRCGYYYLFVSFDQCCNGWTRPVEGDNGGPDVPSVPYNIRVGRATSLLGPYSDKAGTPMMEDGGTLLVEGSGQWDAVGHNFVFFTGDRAYNIYHGYQGPQGQLRVAELVWDDEGWPISGGP